LILLCDLCVSVVKKAWGLESEGIDDLDPINSVLSVNSCKKDRSEVDNEGKLAEGVGPSRVPL